MKLLISSLPIQGNQQGFVLAGSIVLLLVMSVISITGADNATLDERLASNQVLQTNSLSAAESGLIQAQDIANSQAVREAVQGGDAQAIESAWGAEVSKREDWGGVAGAGSPQYILSKVNGESTYWNQAKQRFNVRSRGRVVSPSGKQLSLRDLGAEIASETSSTKSKLHPFASGVVGIHGVVLSGGSRINTFNSDFGEYGRQVTVDGDTFNNKHENEVNDKFSGTRSRTCAVGADVSLSGNVPIFGDLISTGDLAMSGQTPVYGNVYANGNGFLNNSAGQLNGHIYGDIRVKGDLFLGSAAIVDGNVIVGGEFKSNGRVEGTITVGGNAYFSSSSTTHGKVTSGGAVEVGSTGSPPPAIDAVGEVKYPSYYKYNFKNEVNNYHGNLPKSSVIIPVIPTIDDSGEECTPLNVRDPKTGDLGELFTQVLDDANTVALGAWFDAHGCPYCYSSGSNFVFTGGVGNKDASDTVIGTEGAITLLKVDKKVTTAGRLASLTIKGHVTLLVDGDFQTGGATQMNIAPDATLTLLITGRTLLGAGSNLLSSGPFVRPGADGKPRPAVLLYSAYQNQGQTGSNAGVVISGATDVSIAIRAEETTVAVTGSGDIFGSLIAGRIELNGSGDVHFDEALKRVTADGEATESSAVGPAHIISWWRTPIPQPGETD